MQSLSDFKSCLAVVAESIVFFTFPIGIKGDKEEWKLQEHFTEDKTPKPGRTMSHHDVSIRPSVPVHYLRKL